MPSVSHFFLKKKRKEKKLIAKPQQRCKLSSSPPFIPRVGMCWIGGKTNEASRPALCFVLGCLGLQVARGPTDTMGYNKKENKT